MTAAPGLAAEEAARRLARHGPNVLRSAPVRSALAILADQFKSLVVALLAAAAVISFAFGEWVDGSAIAAVLVINAALGFAAEIRAVRSMEALRRLGSVTTRVRRDGIVKQIPATEVVPGDVVLVEGGDVVTADLRLVAGSRLLADESVLTGESVPSEKKPDPAPDGAPLSERHDRLFKGTSVTRGSGEGVVVATGMQTELGRIAQLVEEAEETTTPLERRLEGLARRLVWVTLAIAAATTLLGIAAGKQTLLMLETGIALAVAAIPEGLPIVATIALARGMWRLARRHALIRRLAAVETLGATTLILTDKTGTLTRNQMTVERIALPDGREVMLRAEKGRGEGGPLIEVALQTAALCNDAVLPPNGEPTGALGDPLEVALLVAAREHGIDRKELERKLPRVGEEAFDATARLMATVHRAMSGFRVAVKGAPEAVLAACTAVATDTSPRELTDAERAAWLDRSAHLAADGLRILGVAGKEVESAEAPPYEGLVLQGLFGLHDPPRDDVGAALDACRRAGIRVVMVTGDQAETALAIGRAVGLVGRDGTRTARGSEIGAAPAWSDDRRRELATVQIFSRVDPEQKLDLVDLHQKEGHVVAMTGDGVNDAPALKKADIGVAMGRRGTQVAREAADMVLTDDAFASIVEAVRYGRIVFANIRRFVVYLLSCNVSEILIVGGAAAVSAPLPLLPLQILFLNLVTDVFPALALAMGAGDPLLMLSPPRNPQEPLVGRLQWWRIGVFGTFITLAVVGAFIVAHGPLGLSGQGAVTVSFMTLAFAQLWHVFDMRQDQSRFFSNDVVSNPWVWGALVLCVALLLGAVYLDGAARLLQLAPPSPSAWLVILGMSLLPLLAGQLLLAFRWGKSPTDGEDSTGGRSAAGQAPPARS